MQMMKEEGEGIFFRVERGYFSKNCTYILEYNIYTSSGIVSCRRFDLFIKIGK